MAGPVNPKVGFSYDAPTTDVGGNPFPASKLAKYQVGVGPTPGNYTLIVDDVAFENGRQVSPMTLFSSLAFGQWYAAVRAVSKDGPVSAWSNEAAFVLEAVAPEAPANFTVT